MTDPTYANDLDAVTRDGVTVEKRLTADSSKRLNVEFTLTAATTSPRIVRVADDLPGDVSPDDVGFHPDLGGEDWRCENGQAWFTAVIDGEPVETMYAVRDPEPETAEALATTPEIEAVLTLDGPQASAMLETDLVGD